MVRPQWLLAGLLALVGARSVPASWGVALPPPVSTVDPVLVVCPEGDAVFRLVARDWADNPTAGAEVVLTFGSCPAFEPCPAVPGVAVPYRIDIPNRRIVQTADSRGVAEFRIPMGGTCPDSLVTVYCDGVFFAQRSVVSPDQNGDLVVDAANLALLQSKLGHADPTGDFDGDGIVTAADVDSLQAHRGDVCSAATPVTPSTWGRLKLRYR